MEAADLHGGPPPSEMSPTIDLATLLGHFVALRQEINLQTRAVRVQQEQTADVVGKFQQTLELAQRSQARAEQAERQSQDEKLRPLLGTFADLYDSLATAASQIRRVTSGVLPRLQQMHEEMEDDAQPEAPNSPGTQARSFWSRWILSPTADDAIRANEEQARNTLERVRREREERRERAEMSAEACDQVEDALSALLSGYTMNLERIERGLRKYNLEPISVVGAPFDPDTMESLDGVAGTGRPHNEVVEEVQRGYTLNGKVFRYARVRVARN
jgi:molecular chaperone GrpE